MHILFYCCCSFSPGAVAKLLQASHAADNMPLDAALLEERCVQCSAAPCLQCCALPQIVFGKSDVSLNRCCCCCLAHDHTATLTLEVLCPSANCRRLFYGCFGTADQREGMGAFLEKRKPAFTKNKQPV
jgi:hypothetical protein